MKQKISRILPFTDPHDLIFFEAFLRGTGNEREAEIRLVKYEVYL